MHRRPRLSILSRAPLAPLAPYALIAASAACSSSRATSNAFEAPDASLLTPTAPAPASPRAAQVVESLARVPAFADRLARHAALVPEGDHFRAPATRGAQGSFQRLGGALEATLASHARGALHLAAPASEGFWVDVAAEGLDDVRGELVDGALVFSSAAQDTDVVQLAQPGGLEEIRVVRALPAKSRVVSARYRLLLGPRVADVRVRAGAVELLDAAGVVRITTEPMFAVDAKGTRRALDVSLEIGAGGRTLVATLDVQGLEAPIAIDPFWIAAASALPAPTSDTVAVTLSDGRAVSFGSGAAGVRTAIFDPVTYKWTAAKDTVESRISTFHSAVRLTSGKVLLAGGSAGFSSGPGSLTAELWDPANGGVLTPSMASAHTAGTLVLVDAGKSTERALVLGGTTYYGSGVYYGSVEAYEVSLGAWVPKPALLTPRYGHTATLLDDGTILVAGGMGSSGSVSTAEIYDPAGVASAAVASTMVGHRMNHAATKLLNGKVLLAGGQTNTYTNYSTADLYDPVSKTFSAVPPMKQDRTFPRSALLPDGRVIVIGGFGKVGTANASASTTEIYDPASNTWSDGPTMFSARREFAIAGLSGGRVLVAGGLTTTAISASELLLPDPITCTTSAGCASGNCVDGYCCDTACVGSCVACDLPSAKGICGTVVAEAPHGSHPSCGLYAYCGTSGTCSTNCGNDAGCASGNFCQITGASGACVPKKGDGTACSGDNECTNAHCADGYCCNTGCTGTCAACDVAGKLGVCSVVDGPVHGTRSACPNDYACIGGSCAVTCTKDLDCAIGRYCDAGTGACLQNLANASACTTSRQCASGSCVDGVCCNVVCAGACQACDVTGSTGSCVSVASGPPHGARSCGAYATCTAGACATSCATATDCAAGNYCSPADKCVTGKANAAVCASNAECTSGNCVDGVCCDKPCGAECESCAVAGKEGTCSPRPATAACGGSGCVGASLVAYGHCSGTDATCAVGSVTPCPGNFKCADAKLCKKTCAVDADCASGFSCDVATGACVTAAFDAGVADTGPSDTGAADTGIDDTGVPDSGSIDTGTLDTGRPIADAPAPNVADKPVLSVSFTRCARDGECPSHHCVEGVCCDTACKDRCYSCALLTNPGVCTPEPIGVDLKHECGPGASCLGTCGAGGDCVGSGAGTMCARNRCTGPSTGVGPAFCAGPGADCAEGSSLPFDCAPFVCEPAFGACRADCASSNDCANGFLCDTPTGKCVAPVPTTGGGGADGGGGGCGVTHHGDGALGAGGLAAIAASMAFARRRRARRA